MVEPTTLSAPQAPAWKVAWAHFAAAFGLPTKPGGSWMLIAFGVLSPLKRSAMVKLGCEPAWVPDGVVVSPLMPSAADAPAGATPASAARVAAAPMVHASLLLQVIPCPPVVCRSSGRFPRRRTPKDNEPCVFLTRRSGSQADRRAPRRRAAARRSSSCSTWRLSCASERRRWPRTVGAATRSAIQPNRPAPATP